MRIIAGRHRGRRLAAPAGRNARPTSDRAREALFNILAHWDGVTLDGARVIDCFAGTGALGLEALSRGARHATFVESDPASLAALDDNIATLGERQSTTVIRVDATRLPPAELPCQVAFLDPPYHSALAGPCLTALIHGGWLEKDGFAVVEVAAKEAFAPPPMVQILDERTYGAARLVFLRRS
ncbi:MAG: 16S rRNA (guanine(966)-N(2))-methyltransferase RsmD [Magnetospirillum sp.]|nr:16S rRNA (guanine(966)-N(2))-methyltransferase RsmD [Magnetospirillum sp.]